MSYDASCPQRGLSSIVAVYVDIQTINTNVGVFVHTQLRPNANAIIYKHPIHAFHTSNFLTCCSILRACVLPLVVSLM